MNRQKSVVILLHDFIIDFIQITPVQCFKMWINILFTQISITNPYTAAFGVSIDYLSTDYVSKSTSNVALLAIFVWDSGAHTIFLNIDSTINKMT